MKVATILVLVLAVAGGAPLASADKKPKKPDVPPVMATARTIAVVSRDGDEHNLRVSDEERMAIVAVREFVRSWRRYTVLADERQADIVLVVRKGKSQQENLGAGQNTNPAGRSPMDIGDNSALGRAGPPRTSVDSESDWTGDTLSVCIHDAKGRLSSPVWSRTMDAGLEGPQPALADQLRRAVDKAYPLNPPQQ